MLSCESSFGLREELAPYVEYKEMGKIEIFLRLVSMADVYFFSYPFEDISNFVRSVGLVPLSKLV